MKTLFKNGTVVNVFTGELEKADVLMQDDRIIGVDAYDDADADIVEDITGKYLCPGFIDGHIHIESSMVLPPELVRIALPHGTTSIVTDPHEIANVSGKAGIAYMLAASEGLPMTVYVMLPSCVPATKFDESGAVLNAEDLEEFYDHPRVLGLAEMMNYPGVLCRDETVMKKIEQARRHGKRINGHAPLLSGKDLDSYISAGVYDDHECSNFDEAVERIRKGQWVMIRRGTAARNLEGLLQLFEAPYAHRCLLVTDDKYPADIMKNGHIDYIIRRAVGYGKNVITGIQMATIQAAQCFGLERLGAIAPGYQADLLILDDLNTVAVQSVYKAGKKVAEDGKAFPFASPAIPEALQREVCGTFCLKPLKAEDFLFPLDGVKNCRVIGLLPKELLTVERHEQIDFAKSNGIDVAQDIVKIAVIERHHQTGHIGLGLVKGLGMKVGAIASSVSHDSHNLIVAGASEADMAFAANRIRALGGGLVVVCDGQVIAELSLPYGGLMSDGGSDEVVAQDQAVRRSTAQLGIPESVQPFMTTAFVSLSVIPHLKLTTLGLIDVDQQKIVPFVVE